MFDKFLQRIKRWMHSPQNEASPEVLQEMLVRSARFKELYRNWISEGLHHEPLKNIYTSFTLSHSGISADIPMHVFKRGNSHHVLIHYFDGLGKNIPAFLQDYFRDRVMRIGYNLYLSDRQVIHRISHTEIVERHVLRPYIPAFSLHDKPEQLYGNISIAVHYANDRPMFLELTAEHTISGDFAPAFPFDELAEILFI
jgi:hypothetical protein